MRTIEKEFVLLDCISSYTGGLSYSEFAFERNLMFRPIVATIGSLSRALRDEQNCTTQVRQRNDQAQLCQSPPQEIVGI
jgi:hypothetical protein